MKKRSFKWLFIVGTILILSGAVYYYYSGERTNKQTVHYTESQVERGSISTSILSTGVVRPENRVEVKSPIAGRAEKVLVEEGDGVKKGQRLVLMSSTERAALLDAALARGPDELKKWENLYRPTSILAPVSGTIIQRQIEEGQTFSISEAILVMADRLIVEAQVDETDLAQVKIGQKAEVTLDAYPDKPVAARVDSIAFEATTINNVTTYIVKLAPVAVPPFMRSGMTSNVRFEVASREDVLIVPSGALSVENGDFRILKRGAQPEDRVSVSVSVGINDGKRTEIKSGLNDSDTILIPANSADTYAKPANTNPFAPKHPGGGRR